MVSIHLELLPSALSDIHGYYHHSLLVPVPIVTILIILIIIILFRQVSSTRRYQLNNCVRYPHRDPILGLDILLQCWQDMNANRYSERSRLQHQTYGPTFVTCVLRQMTINTIDPENIVTVTTTHFEDYVKSDWTKLVRKYMGSGILMNDDADWKLSRDLLRPAFMRNRADDLVMIERHTKNLVDRIATKYEGGKYFDFKKEVSLLIMDITTEMLFGKSVGTLTRQQPHNNHHDDDDDDDDNGYDEEGRFFQLVDQLEPIGTMFIELGPLAVVRFLFQRKRILAIVNGIQGFFHRAVVEAFQQKKSKSKSKSMKDDNDNYYEHRGILHMIIDAGNTPDDVQGELQNLFFAAYDTTTALVTNIFDILGRRPDVMQKLRQQVDDQLSGRHPTGTDLAQMEYLRYVIFESTYSLLSSRTIHIMNAQAYPLTLFRFKKQSASSPP
jgi:cytochrome P450